MDSVSQAALGAAVGVVVLGRRQPVWQSALAGALVGTLADDGRRLSITDLRMGQNPYYAFNFEFAEYQSPTLKANEPHRITRRIPIGPGLQWLKQRALGDPAAPPR